MLRNYLKTAWRNLFKNKAFSTINILGLSLGMACSLLIMLWVWDEKGMDSFHQNDNHLYVVYEQQHHDGQIDGGYSTPGLLAEEVKQVFPEVKYSTAMAWGRFNTFEGNDKILKVAGDFGSPDFFSVFSFPLLAGTKETALKTTSDMAISRKMAEDFFGSVEAAIGQPMRYENRKDVKVSAVFENLPSNTSMKFDFILNWETFLEENSWAREWGNNGPACYLVFQEGTDVTAFENKFRDFLQRHKDAQSENFVIKFGLQKYSEQYLHSKFENGEIVGGRVQYVNLFSIIAVFIVLIACINFMNLTTARSIKRGKEIGVRKVVGAFRGALIRQFIGEAVLIVLLGFVIGMLLVFFALPVFNSVTQKQILLPLDQVQFWLMLGFIVLLIGFVSGSYPALYLSGFNPVSAFKGSLKFSSGALWFRKGLVVFQFALSIMLIIGTIVVSKQVSYVQSVHLGYDKENLIYIRLEGDLSAKYKVFKDMAQQVPGVKLVSRITNRPTQIENGTGGVVWEGKDPNSMLQFTQAAIGYDFMKTMNIQMLQGRDFSPEFQSDSSGYIVNEKALKLFNYKDPIGMPLQFWGNKGTIVGVVKDFHFNSLHTDINPLVLRLGEEINRGWALIRLEAGKTPEALAGLEKVCKELNPQFPFAHQFSDEEYNYLYTSEQVIDKLSNAFAFLAIFISCLGLLGLTMFTTEQRIKEIGIRKILGAPLFSLFNLLSKEILMLVSIAILIASPLAWYAMHDWLKDYAYKIDLTIWIFLLAGALAIIIALITISAQTIKALLANPVKSLRSE
jgi:ABC-type antimicrobial peptide transport system permease subunit